MSIQIEDRGNAQKNITINQDKSPLFGRIIVLLLTIIPFMIPIVATIYALFEYQLLPGILITYAIFRFSGYYLLKLFLWNSYGKEIIQIRKDKIIYYADYKLFKHNYLEFIKNQTLKIKDKEAEKGRLTIESNENKVVLNKKLPLKDLHQILEMIKKYDSPKKKEDFKSG